MGKYEPLATHLESAAAGEWSATFAQVEQVLGFPLPPSARKHREWWSNQVGAGHSQARGWQDAGWQVGKVDLQEEKVIFRRRPVASWAGDAGQSESIEGLFEQASAYLGTDDRERIVQEALKALCQREAARRLALLGGTMPDLKAPPRRRFG
ncbi:MAG TPA: hypothetical protein VF718_06065 [Allosphingosinicella sp.]